MKNPWEWNEADLLDMIAEGWKESIDLDFKQSDALQNTDGKKGEISKDVSAFANSAGGTIVYGIAENGLIAQSVDNGSDPMAISKEWLENVINSRIQRRIDGVRIHQIELTKTSPGRVAYVVSIPQSVRAAHQASDKKFYKRFNFQSIPMEEYEVRDVSRRVETPDLRIYFKLNLPPNYTQGAPASEPFFFDAIITNDALEAANYAVIELLIDGRLNILSAPGLSITQNMELAVPLEHEPTTHPITILRLNWNIPNKLPIFQAHFKVADSTVMAKAPEYTPFTRESYLLGYRIQAPRMSIKQAFTFLTLASSTIKLSDSCYSYDELISNYRTIQWDRNDQHH